MSMRPRRRGFTLIELLVVMVIIAMLLTLAAPRYFSSIDNSKEAVLRENLETTRRALDKYYGDNGKYPDTLDQLVSKKYLRSLPMDPFTGSATTWVIVPPQDPDQGGVYDIRSGSPDTAKDGSALKSW